MKNDSLFMRQSDLGLLVVFLLGSVWLVIRVNYSVKPTRVAPIDQTCDRHRETVARSCFECECGRCFLGKCFCLPPLIGECSKDECFFSDRYGVTLVTQARWDLAQKEEANAWNGCDTCIDDRWKDHAQGFQNYVDMIPIGQLFIEMGCGPYTQSRYIFEQARPDLLQTLRSITLLDPNLFSYVRHVVRAAFKDGELVGRKVVLIGGPVEQFPLCETYDTLLVINVIEHVQNAFDYFESIYYSLKDGGQLVFHDRAWQDYNPVLHHDHYYQDWAYHPIRVTSELFRHFFAFFKPIYCEVYRDDYPIRGDQYTITSFSYYFIGRKRPREEVWAGLYTQGRQTSFPGFDCLTVDSASVKNRSFGSDPRNLMK